MLGPRVLEIRRRETAMVTRASGMRRSGRDIEGLMSDLLIGVAPATPVRLSPGEVARALLGPFHLLALVARIAGSHGRPAVGFVINSDFNGVGAYVDPSDGSYRLCSIEVGIASCERWGRWPRVDDKRNLRVRVFLV